MRILVADPVPERVCRAVVGVAEVHRHLAADPVAHVARGLPDAERGPVRLGGGGQVDHGLGQVELGLGEAHVLDGVGGGRRHHQAHRVGLADVLAGQDDQAAGDEAGVLTGLEHAGQVVQGGLGVGPPDALDEGRDHVVVLVAAVAVQLGAERGLGVVEGDGGLGGVRVAGPGERHRHLQAGQRVPPVAAGPVGQVGERLVVGGRALGLEALAQQRGDGPGVEGLEPEQGGARQQGGVDLEVRVLGGCAHQHQEAALDRGQQGVLLGLVEPVDLVEEQDRALSPLPQPLGRLGDDLAHVLDAGGHGRELLVGLGRVPGDHLGERGLARARRPPEDGGRQAVGLDQHPQRPARPHQLVLSDDVVEPQRPQPGCQGGLLRQRTSAAAVNRSPPPVADARAIAARLSTPAARPAVRPRPPFAAARIRRSHVA